jgi:general secretion pathway protein D
VLEVNRDKIRDLGITLPTSIGLTPQITTTSTTTTTSTSTASSSSALTLYNLTHLNASDFGVTITGATVNALLSDTDTRVLQNPRIRATDGQNATLKIGQRIPVATGSYNSGVSTGVASVGVQTQFTYIDVGVNIDITPTVSYDREVSLKTKVEVSQQNGSVTISGVTEPIIAQRVLTQTIKLRDGEPSMLAGIVTKQDNLTVSGTPGLGELPFFKFFFSSQDKEVQTDEIVFLLIPHIVRESVLTRLNTTAIDTGTSSEVELRKVDTPQLAAMNAPITGAASAQGAYAPTTAARAAEGAIQEMNTQAAPVMPASGSLPAIPPSSVASGAPPAIPPSAITTGTRTNPTASAFTPPVTFSISPVSSNETVGSTFQTAIVLKDGQDIASVPMQLQFDPRVLQLVNVDAGDFLAKGGENVQVAHRVESNGQLTIAASRLPNVAGVSGGGNVCILTFKAAAPGDAVISFLKVGAKDSKLTAIAASGSSAVVHVK